MLWRVSSPQADEYGNPAGLTDEIDIARAIYDAFAHRDVEAALPFVDDACVVDLPGTAALSGRQGAYRGRDGVREYFADVGRVWDELTLEAESFRAVRDGVVVLGRVRGRRGDEELDRHVAWTWQFRDGRAVHVRANDLGSGGA